MALNAQIDVNCTKWRKFYREGWEDPPWVIIKESRVQGTLGGHLIQPRLLIPFVQLRLKMQTAQPLWVICYTAYLSTWYHFFFPLYLTQASRVRLRSSLLILWQRAQPYLLSKLLFRNRKVAVSSAQWTNPVAWASPSKPHASAPRHLVGPPMD